MRKLRDDITLKEAITWTEGLKDCVGSGGTLWALAQRLGTCRERNASKTPYPDSFYEDPIVGCFGRFSRILSNNRVWGFLLSYNPEGSWPYTMRNGSLWNCFKPGIPDSVDENGWPKEKA